MQEDILVKCDGACLPNNPGGTATWGFVVYEKGKRIHEDCGVVCKGKDATCNVAEYWAVIHALEYLRENYLVRSVRVQSDSQLVINQIRGFYKINARRLKPLLNTVLSQTDHFEHIRFQWIPREQNKEADALTEKAYYGR